MDLTLEGVLIDLLARRLSDAKVGIVIRGIRDLRPVSVAAHVAARLQTRLAVAVVGYPIEAAPPAIELADTIEAAVGWRNQSSVYAGRILVFVPGDVDKLGSLHSLDEVTTRDLSLHLITWVSQQPELNIPQRRFWEGLCLVAATLPFPRLLDYISVVRDMTPDPDALPAELWRLGLLEDQSLLDANVNVVERIERNRGLILAIAQLSDRSRKRMNQVLRHARGPQQARLRDAARQLRAYFARNDRKLLRGLHFADVERLLEAGKIDPAPSPPENDIEIGDAQLHPGRRQEQTLRGQELAEVVAGQIVRGENRASIAAYTELVRRQIRAEENDQSDPVDDEALSPIAGGRTIVTNVRPQTRKLWSFVGAFCTTDYWGGTMTTEQHNLRDVVQRFTSGTNVAPFDPRETTDAGPGLVELLQDVEQQLDGGIDVMESWEQLAVARSELLPHIDLLIAEPIALLYSNIDVREAMQRYLDAYAALLEKLRSHGPILNQRFHRAYRAILQGILRLDAIFVLAPGDEGGREQQRRWKALLTPLHPLHLWRYRTILERAGPQLNPEQQAQLTQALPKLPHLLHFVALNDARLGRITLPQAGSIETLPIYENRTNRYLGNDGVEFLSDLLRSWLTFAPYTQRQIRLALIDVPYLPDALREIREFLASRTQTSLVVEAYRTRPQHIFEHLAEMEFEGQDSTIAKLMLSDRLSLNLYLSTSLRDVTDRLREHPVHVIYSFDQSSYDVTQAGRHNHLVVSPLVVTYEYSYDGVYKKGSIAPTSDAESGLFAAYHALLYQAIDLQEDQSFQVQLGRGNDVDALNQALVEQSARWLVVADRTMLGYAPHNAVPLLEELCGRREVAVWAHATSRSIRQFTELLLTFRLQPNEQHIVRLMQRYGHIAAGGLFSTVRGANLSVAQRHRQQKGLVGTVLAAHWYTSRYPGALVASLDSGLARQWLAVEASTYERADLVGLRVDDSGTLIIDVIEVKTVDRLQSEVRVTNDAATRSTRLSGDAINQLRMTLQKIEPIFHRGDKIADLFTHARCEALKYQLYRECFRELHPDTDQARWFELLNQAFHERRDAPPVPVKCRGMVVHVVLNEHGEDEQVTDVDGVLSLIRLRPRSIQRLIVPATGMSALYEAPNLSDSKDMPPITPDEEPEPPPSPPNIQGPAGDEPMTDAPDEVMPREHSGDTKTAVE
jgi:DNA segregation ATPase FtsK/SpoIIIE, S-DNA-T family